MRIKESVVFAFLPRETIAYEGRVETLLCSSDTRASGLERRAHVHASVARVRTYCMSSEAISAGGRLFLQISNVSRLNRTIFVFLLTYLQLLKSVTAKLFCNSAN